MELNETDQQKLALADEIVSAWTVPGRVPAHHAKMQRRVCADMPVLAEAIKKLVRASGLQP